LHFPRGMIVPGPPGDGNSLLVCCPGLIGVARALMQNTPLMIRGNVLGGDVVKAGKFPDGGLRIPVRGVLQGECVAGKCVGRIGLEQGLEAGPSVTCHRSSISFARARSLEVTPPALCVLSVSVTLFHRMSMSG